jgi:hypothetical protein
LQYKQALGRYERRYSEASDAPSSALRTPAGRLAVLIGCDGYGRPPPADAELLAIPGMRDDLSSTCPISNPPQTTLPRMEVRTFGLPWGLVGSPRRPARQHRSEPVQLNNLWLSERQ